MVETGASAPSDSGGAAAWLVVALPAIPFTLHSWSGVPLFVR
jgi:hypothetical protein